MATMDDSTIALHCEMRAFIRPDSSLIWERPGGQRINGTEKYQITFSDGSPDIAANGGGVLVPSRVSTLTITNPEPSDAGTYTCNVMGTSEVVTIELIVNGTKRIDTTDVNTTDVKVTNINTNTTDSDHAVATELVVSGSSTSDTTVTGESTTNASSPTLLIYIVVGSMIAVMFGLLTTAALTTISCCLIKHAKNKSHRMPDDSDVNPMYDYPDSVYHHGVQSDDCELRTASRMGGSLERNAAIAENDINTTEKAVITDTNVAYGVANNGMNASMETNMAYGVADTIMDNNEAYGAAIDGVGIDTMNRNIAYGAVITVHDDTAGNGVVESDDENIYY